MTDGYYCTRIEDKWGNYISISYHDSTWYHEAYNDFFESSNPGKKVIYQKIPQTIQEHRADGTALRKAVINIVQPGPAALGMEVVDRPWRITSVSFFAPGASSSFMTYNLSYLQYGATDFNLDRLQLPAYADSPMTWTFDWASYWSETDPKAAETDWIYPLESVSVESTNLQYGFKYWTCATDNGGVRDSHVECSDQIDADDTLQSPSLYEALKLGVLRQVTLPTEGVIDYEYQTWAMSHHHQDAVDHNGDECYFNAIFCTGEEQQTESFCADVTTFSLGIASRTVTDGGVVVERKELEQRSESYLSLPVRLDVGYLDHPNPVAGYPNSTNTALYNKDYYTSRSRTRVTKHYVVDEGGSYSSNIGAKTRSDQSEYHFSLGNTGLNRQGDCMIVPFQDLLYTLPLSGALIYEQHFLGSDPATRLLVRTTVFTYVVDDYAGWTDTTKSLYGTQVNRRSRELISYYHGAGAGGEDLVTVSRRHYEADDCMLADDSCPNLPSAWAQRQYGFASNRTRAESHSSFTSWSAGFSEEAMFDPLASAVFDRSGEISYWKVGLSKWLIHRANNEYVSHSGAASDAQERSWEYGAGHGELLREWLHFAPSSAAGGQIDDQDIVTEY
jgi:hypothetical protein